MDLTRWSSEAMQNLVRALHALPDLPHWNGDLAVAWVHEISLAALAAAVITLGLVMLLELRSLARLRRSVDDNLARVFEQLDLLRLDYTQLLEVQVRRGAAAPSATVDALSSATQLLASLRAHEAGARDNAARDTAARAKVPTLSAVALANAPLAAGEARLLASLAQARTRGLSTPLAAARHSG